MNNHGSALHRMRTDARLTAEQLAALLCRGKFNSTFVTEAESGERNISFMMQFRWFYHCSTHARLHELGLVQGDTIHRSMPLVKKLAVHIPVFYFGILLLMFFYWT